MFFLFRSALACVCLSVCLPEARSVNPFESIKENDDEDSSPIELLVAPDDDGDDFVDMM